MARAVLVALVNGNQTRAKASTTHYQKERQNRGVLSSATVDHSGPFTKLQSDRLVLYKAFAPVFLQSCVPVYVRVHTGVGGDVGNHVHSALVGVAALRGLGCLHPALDPRHRCRSLRHFLQCRQHQHQPEQRPGAGDDHRLVAFTTLPQTALEKGTSSK